MKGFRMCSYARACVDQPQKGYMTLHGTMNDATRDCSRATTTSPFIGACARAVARASLRGDTADTCQPIGTDRTMELVAVGLEA